MRIKEDDGDCTTIDIYRTRRWSPGARQSEKEKTDGVLAPSVVDSVADCVVIWCMDCTISLHSYTAVSLALPTCRDRVFAGVCQDHVNWSDVVELIVQ